MDVERDVLRLLEQRIQNIEKTLAVDKYRAEKERSRRELLKEQTRAARLTVNVKRHGEEFHLAEHVNDAVKFNSLIKTGILKKWKGDWVVNRGLAETKGYLVRVIE
jgi:L-lactate utilization protein LutB